VDQLRQAGAYVVERVVPHEDRGDRQEGGLAADTAAGLELRAPVSCLEEIASKRPGILQG